ncbi:unnamed protein product, partial [marine sediment metagenome]
KIIMVNGDIRWCNVTNTDLVKAGQTACDMVIRLTHIHRVVFNSAKNDDYVVTRPGKKQVLAFVRITEE